MSTPLPAIASASPPRLGILGRFGAVAAVLAIETLFFSYLIQRTPVDWVTGPARLVRDTQHWVFRFIIVYAVTLAMLVYLRGTARHSRTIAGQGPLRAAWLGAHLVLLLPFTVLSASLYSGALPLPFAVVAIAWHACALAAALALVAAAAPLRYWSQTIRQAGILPLYALMAALAAVFAIQASQLLWQPTAAFTFRLVQLVLQPLLPTLHSDFGTLTLATGRFAVTVAEQCSGLEGVGLMLVFCTTWLWYFRREYYFPRALWILPAAAALVFFFNVLRIAALVLIGHAGYPGIASVGFHSQAGWIAFNVVALGVAILSKHSAWIHRSDPDTAAVSPAKSTAAGSDNVTAAYLMPLLAILAAAMIAHALSAGFENLYPLRLAVAVAVLWVYRRHYDALDWRVSWRAPVVGTLIAVVWLLCAHFLLRPSSRPAALADLAAPWRTVWIASRILAAIVTVPIAEELAYRGYLMRRLVSAEFHGVSFRAVCWPALMMCSLIFGVMHGALWLPAILAGLAYGAVAIRTGRIGEAVAAHATTNALLAVAVLFFDQWQLW